jgi:hypothetical protein
LKFKNWEPYDWQSISRCLARIYCCWDLHFGAFVGYRSQRLEYATNQWQWSSGEPRGTECITVPSALCRRGVCSVAMVQPWSYKYADRLQAHPALFTSVSGQPDHQSILSSKEFHRSSVRREKVDRQLRCVGRLRIMCRQRLEGCCCATNMRGRNHQRDL